MTGAVAASSNVAGLGASRTLPSGVAPAAKSEQQALAAYGNLPLAFVANGGQTDARVRYSAHAGGASFYFTRKEAVFVFARGSKTAALRLAFLGANHATTIEGRRSAAGKVNYLLGKDPAKWQTGMATYGEVVYSDLWPGIDMVFRGGAGRLKYEFVLRPGANPGDIRLRYHGAGRLAVSRAGDLMIPTPTGTLRDERPRTYQTIRGSRVPVPSRFAVEAGDRGYGFAIGAYDVRQPLVIDPGLLYSTYVGGPGNDRAFGMAVDGTGSAYITGETGSLTFPATAGAFDTSFNGVRIDAFVTKLNATGTALLYSTYLGGSSDDAGYAIAVDGAGSAYVTGFTGSNNFPTTAGAFDTTFAGADAFVAKLNSTGSALAYATYLGGSLEGSGEEIGRGIALDAAGNAYVAGLTGSSNFPTTAGAFDTTFAGELEDAFVTKLNATGSALLYSTFLGGAALDDAWAIAVEGAGSALVTGVTRSSDFPTTLGAFDTARSGSTDAFVTRLDATGSALAYSTYLGGGAGERGDGVATDGAGSAYVTGSTGSPDFPTTAGAFDTSFNGAGGFGDAFVTKMNATGTGVVYSTYVGGSGGDGATAITLDSSTNAYITGETLSSNFPTTATAFDTTLNGVSDAFVTVVDASGSTVVYSSYFGGSGSDIAYAVGIDGDAIYAAGDTTSTDLPTSPGAFDTSANGGLFDAFVAKLTPSPPAPATLTLSPPADINPVGTSHTVTATVEDAGGQPVADVNVRFSVTGANSTGGSDATDANGEATFTYTGTTAGVDTITAYADTDGDGVQDGDEPAAAATKTWTPGAPTTLTLAPSADTNTVGEEHCVTATARDAFGNPVPGVKVRFSVPTAPTTAASPASGSDVTDSNGEATFCYSASLPGEDTIDAFADTDDDGQQDAAEPTAAATKTWLPPDSTPDCKVSNGGRIAAANADRATFGGNAKSSAAGSAVTGQEQFQDHGPTQPTVMHSIELTALICSPEGGSATIFGTATVGGTGSYAFRIDVTDAGEPGLNDTYGIVIGNGYASGVQPLEDGNIQIQT